MTRPEKWRLTFFHSKQAWLEKILPVGETVLVSGKVEWFNGRPSMVHPDHIVAEADADSLPLIEPVYPLTAGLSPKVLRRSIEAAIDILPSLPEWADPHLVAKTAFRFRRQRSASCIIREAPSISNRNTGAAPARL
jgi:ATP-dependent DNA helicase RecG